MSIRGIHDELLQLNVSELREFYKMFVPMFNVNILHLSEGHFFKDVEYALNDKQLELEHDVCDILSSIASDIPVSNRIERYYIQTIKTNIMDGLNIVLIMFERPVYEIINANLNYGDNKVPGAEPCYVFTVYTEEDLVMAVDLSYIETTPFAPLFYIMRGIIDFIISIPSSDIRIDRNEDKLKVEMMKSLLACDVLYEDAALHVLEQSLLHFPDTSDDVMDDYQEIIDEMWEYFETDYKGKYYKSDIIEEE